VAVVGISWVRCARATVARMPAGPVADPALTPRPAVTGDVVMEARSEPGREADPTTGSPQPATAVATATTAAAIAAATTAVAGPWGRTCRTYNPTGWRTTN